ncbi:hypothetical protein Ocin01_16769 [Orchesella cincta]|uniref:Uncharacterized protein n=1 Tax=Orchesella cincta TaxID=48709 RepID=A0A1D2MAH2_ORCCI|nr:hypothetical protein Ocin01_16769 [Orchesella cincta]
MSSRKGQLGAVNKDLAAQTKLQEQLSTILNCKEHFNKVCEDPALQTFQSEVIGLLNAMKLFVHLDTGLREKLYDASNGVPHCHEIVSSSTAVWMPSESTHLKVSKGMTAKLRDGVVGEAFRSKEPLLNGESTFERFLRGEVEWRKGGFISSTPSVHSNSEGFACGIGK